MKRFLFIATAALAVLMLLPADTTLDSIASPQWEILCSDATATVYHADAAQCNADFLHTASMFRIDADAPGDHRILAMERTMMQKYGIAYGDIVRIDGAETLDGLWRVEDTMSSRYKGQHRIDFLVNRNVRGGKWKNVTVSRPANDAARHSARSFLAAL